jgi:hypothetical protein
MAPACPDIDLQEGKDGNVFIELTKVEVAEVTA